MNKKVAAIVVTFNRITLLKECIEALRKQSYAEHGYTKSRLHHHNASSNFPMS